MHVAGDSVSTLVHDMEYVTVLLACAHYLVLHRHWDCGVIYCTIPTAKLVREKLKVSLCFQCMII
jgi:hypothetical protein